MKTDYCEIKEGAEEADAFVISNLWNLCNLWINRGRLTAHCRLLTAHCLWWRRRESNPDPKVNAEGIYMLSCFSFRVSLAARAIFAHFQLSEAARRWNGLVRL